MVDLLLPKPFAELFTDHRERAHALEAFHKAIADSFLNANGRMRHPTQDEVRRRFKILETAFRDMRGVRGWTYARCYAALPNALTCALEGRDYVPDTRTLWVPGDGAP